MTVVKFLLKILFGVFVLVFIIAVCLIGLAIWSVPKLGAKGIDSWVESRTGFSAIVNSVELKVFSGSLGIEGMALLNPPYYQNKNFMQIKEIAIKMEPMSLLRERVVFDYVFIDIDRVTLVKNAQGSINAKEFFEKLGKKGKKYSSFVEKREGESANNKKEKSARNYIIKKLIIKVGGVDTVGLSTEKDVQNFALNYSKEFTDVTDIESVMNQVIRDFGTNEIFNFAREIINTGLDKVINKVMDKKIPEKLHKGIEKHAEKVFRYLQKAVK